MAEAKEEGPGPCARKNVVKSWMQKCLRTLSTTYQLPSTAYLMKYRIEQDLKTHCWMMTTTMIIF